MDETLEEKLVNMDTRIMYLEDSLQQMSLQMMKKDRLLEVLQMKLDTLEDKLKDMDERKMNRTSEGAVDERPPHY